MTTIAAARLFDGITEHHHCRVVIEAGRIAALVPGDAGAAAQHRIADDGLLVPGFVDLQVNGGGGVLFNDTPTLAGLRHIAHAHAVRGTTAILPTLVSGSGDQVRAALAAVREAAAAALPGIAGLHIEGPFIAPARRGIHPQAALRVPGEAEIAALCQKFPLPLLLTVAPEIVAAPAIARLAGCGVAVFLGHSDAGIEAAQAALGAGARGFTHLFNAMSPFASRAPGMVGAALDDGRAVAGMIVDGWHVHPAAVRVAWRALGPARLFLVSDAMPSVGDEAAGGFVLNGQKITLRDGRLTDQAGTLAGAHLTMAEAVGNAVRLAAIPLAQALRMATHTPAEVLGLADRGRIAVGARADLVELGPDLRPRQVWQGGAALL